ncbi:hypothetical protein [Xanthomonas sacchari]|uniref:hypothetical protein n=1 Tax=Xanthomonas sacchari TaxID=56458 RepID=UPI0011108890|nr:hypothetical protein [Xanthomonas sacchari]MDV0438283.1 hypothetical protein [Xanthomonas sacchari]
MDRKRLAALTEGRFEQAFACCELRQRGTDTPRVISGGGFLSQNSNGELLLHVVAHEVRDFATAMTLDFNRPWVAGRLIPETAYYDLKAWTLAGDEWRAERVSADMDHGTNGTHARVKLWRIETNWQRQQRTESAMVAIFIPGGVDLPWHVWTSKGELGGALDRFEYESEPFYWRAKKEEGGVMLHFFIKGESAEPAFTHFWRALCIVLGHPVEPPEYSIVEGDRETLRLATRRKELMTHRLMPPIRNLRPSADDTHAFLHAFLLHATGSTKESNRPREGYSELIFRHWHRILRARESDIENSALVLSVAVEGLLNEAFANEHDVDDVFIQQLDRAKPILKDADLEERARACVLSSIGNARRPRVGDVLRRLIEQGVLSQRHLDAWSGMRHASAHGGVLSNDELALQEHIDRFHVCLDLFYRLVFILIGYRGNHCDYSFPCDAQQHAWPDVHFPPVPRQSADGDHRGDGAQVTTIGDALP